MGWHKLRAELTEHHRSSIMDIDYLIISQVYHIFFDQASLMSRHSAHDHRKELSDQQHLELLFQYVQEELNRLKQKVSKQYHNRIDEIADEAKELLGIPD